MAPFKRLVRFKSSVGTIHFGETDVRDPSKESLVGTSVRVYNGSNPWDSELKLTEEKAEIVEAWQLP